jgi:predicted transcriptional regulator
MSRANGSRTSKLDQEQRVEQALQMIGEGKTQTEIAELLGISRVSLWRNLKTLTQKVQAKNETQRELEIASTLAVYELAEQALLTGQIDSETANSWRRIRDSIARLKGLNAPTTAIVARTTTDEVDPKLLGRYRRFVYETRHMSDADLEKVYEFCRPLNVYTPMNPKPPATSELWEDDEPKQLTEGDADGV